MDRPRDEDRPFQAGGVFYFHPHQNEPVIPPGWRLFAYNWTHLTTGMMSDRPRLVCCHTDSDFQRLLKEWNRLGGWIYRAVTEWGG